MATWAALGCTLNALRRNLPYSFQSPGRLSGRFAASETHWTSSCRSPSGPRNVGNPDAADTPAPVSRTIREYRAIEIGWRIGIIFPESGQYNGAYEGLLAGAWSIEDIRVKKVIAELALGIEVAQELLKV